MRATSLTLLFFVFFLSGCYVEKHIVDPLSPNGQTKLAAGKSVYVSLPDDGHYGHIKYHNSGQMTATAIKSALSAHIKDVVEGRVVEGYDNALSSARKLNRHYLFYPTILQWEDRATEWSGKADKITIKIVVVDVGSNTEISSVNIKSHSSWWTFGGDHPQDLLHQPISQYVDSLL